MPDTQIEPAAITTKPPAKPARLHWKPALIILAVAGVLLSLAWKVFDGDRTHQIFAVLGVVPTTLVLLLVWWTFFSRVTWRARFTGLGVLALAAIVFGSLVRVTGFSGDMVPQLAWRWKPTHAEQARKFWEAKSGPPPLPQKESPSTATGSLPALESPGQAQEPDWPDFRGPQRDGVVHQVSLRKDWSEHPPRLIWRHPVGPAWSSFTVEGHRAFTQEQHGALEAVVCYDFATGGPLWSHTDPARFDESPSGEGPRSTPTLYDGRVYALGATGILNCLDLESGNLIWTKDIMKDNDAKPREWGVSCSPLVFDEVVVVNPGGPKGRGVVAYNRRTGERAWSAGNSPASFASPQLAVLDGQRQILIFDGDGLAGHDALRGKELWRFEWHNLQRINVVQPVVLDEQQVFIGTGYGKGSAVVRVTFGEVAWSCEPVWTTRELKPKFNGVVLRDEFLYGLDEGILTCLDARTGERKWKHGRYRYGQVLLVEDTLLVQSESGELVLVDASPEGHLEFGRFQALEGTCWNEPVLCKGRLLVRSNAEAACYEIRTEDGVRSAEEPGKVPLPETP